MRSRAASLALLLGLSGCSPGASPLDATVGDAAALEASAPDAPDVLDAAPQDSARPPACVRASRDAGAPPPGPCNGATELCGRAYNQVVYPTTHNAFSTVAEGFAAYNQTNSLARQLQDGVRGVMLDVHPMLGRPALCHGACALGSRPLRDGLCDLARAMDDNPRDVFTIIFESYVSAADVEGAFREVGLLEQVHAQPVGMPWPTLGAMAASGRRLVVFTDREGGALPWYMDVWAHAWEVPFSAQTPADLGCTVGRGTRGNPLWIFNHFLTNPVAAPELAEMVNHDPFLLDRARRCQSQFMQLPNFVTVDFYEVGDLFPAVRALNGL